MLHVDDTEALNLGQFVAQDTESGGVERIKPKNTLQRMGTEMRSFANLLLRTSDDEMSFAGLVDANGANVLKWMSQRGFISHTQYKSAFDSKGNLTPESKHLQGRQHTVGGNVQRIAGKSTKGYSCYCFP